MTPEARRRRRVRTPVLMVTAVAWAALLLVPLLDRGESGTTAMPAMHDHTMHDHTMHDHGGHVHAIGGDSGGSVLGFAGSWSLMVVAMMAPLLIIPLRHVHARSLPRRRGRAMTLLVLAAAVVWVVAGPVLLGIARIADGTGVPAVAALVVLMVWQLTPGKQRTLNRHHTQPPLAAFGRAADRDVLRYGATHALWCLGSCWPLMLLPLTIETGHLAVMAIASVWMWAEMFDRPRLPSWRLRLPVRAVRIVAAAMPMPAR